MGHACVGGIFESHFHAITDVIFIKKDISVDEQWETKQQRSIEIYDKISLYLTEEGLISPAERVRFLELLQEGVKS